MNVEQKIERHAETILSAIYRFRTVEHRDPDAVLVPFEVPFDCMIYGIPLKQLSVIRVVGEPGRSTPIEVVIEP